MDSSDPLRPLYRRFIREGRAAAVASRLTGKPEIGGGRNVVPTKVVAVILSSGELVPPMDYSLRPFRRHEGGYDQRLIYWRIPVMTAGMTILFEGRECHGD